MTVSPEDTNETPQRRRAVSGFRTIFPKRMRAKYIFLPILALLLVAGALFFRHYEAAYTARDCIVQMDLTYPEDASLRHIKPAEEKLFFFVATYATANRIPLSGHGFGYQKERPLFIRFYEDCARKAEFAHGMADAFMKDFPSLMRITVADRPRAKYTRSECIVRIDISYAAGKNTDEIGETEKLILKNFGRYYFDPKLAIGGIALGLYSRKHVFLQFKNACERRFAISRELVEDFARNFPGEAVLEVSEDIVSPGRDNIESRGPYWIDGYDHIPFR